MYSMLVRNWWTVALRGLIAVLFGIIIIALPGITLGALVILFGAFALVGGIIALIAAFRERGGSDRWWMLLIQGIIGIAIGIITFIYPTITALALLYLIAIWAILTGIFELVAAIQLRREIQNEWLLAIAGVASVLFGILLFVFPGAGVLAILWLIGVYAIVIGILQIILAFRLKALRQDEPVR